MKYTPLKAKGPILRKTRKIGVKPGDNDPVSEAFMKKV